MPTTFATPATHSLYAPIAAELEAVEAMLRSELRSEHPFVDELVRYGCLLGGKRLRPALLLLTAKAIGGRVTSDHIKLATVVEMIHTATLVHDDVLDEAVMRRHFATVNARWDNEASVLLGDFLFTHAFYLASTLDTVDTCRLIGRATNTVCEGELRQKGNRVNFQLTEDEYLEIIEAKTAALTAVSCRLGALASGADSRLADQMDGFGRDLGIAFQIADDLLDVVGDEQVTGKSLGTDLAKQTPTLPLIRALEVATASDRQSILDIVSGNDRRPGQLVPYLDRYGAIDYSRQRAQMFACRARQHLENLSQTSAREALELASELVASRSK